MLKKKKKKLEGLEISTITLTQVQDKKKKSSGIWADCSKGLNHSHCPINFDVIHHVRKDQKLRPMVWRPGL